MSRDERIRTGCCPHCGQRIDTLEAATILNWDGIEKHIVIDVHGERGVIAAGEYNPENMKPWGRKVDHIAQDAAAIEAVFTEGLKNEPTT